MTEEESLSRNKEGTINGPDDISAMAGNHLMSNMFHVKVLQWPVLPIEENMQLVQIKETGRMNSLVMLMVKIL